VGAAASKKPRFRPTSGQAKSKMPLWNTKNSSNHQKSVNTANFGGVGLHQKHQAHKKNGYVDQKRFTETKRKLAQEKKKSRNATRKLEKMKIESKKWRARVIRLTKVNSRLQEKRLQSSSVKANEISFSKVCKQLQTVEKEKEVLVLQVNNLQEEAEDLRKDSGWKTKELMEKQQAITELQNKLEAQSKITPIISSISPNIRSISMRTPARSNRIPRNKMSVRRLYQSAQRKMYFTSIMKDALPEHVKQLQVNQGNRRRILRGEGSPPRGSILKTDLPDYLED